MPEGAPTVAEEIERYLRTGDTDSHLAAWPDGSFVERARRADADLRGALVREVCRLAAGHSHPPLPASDTVALTRRKVEPMVLTCPPILGRSGCNRVVTGSKL